MSGDRIRIRKRWNGAEATEVSIDALWDLHLRDEAGGVCGAFPRAFLCAHVWCDHVVSGALGHFCREGPPPHDLLVYVLPNDNSEEEYAVLRAKLRR